MSSGIIKVEALMYQCLVGFFFNKKKRRMKSAKRANDEMIANQNTILSLFTEILYRLATVGAIVIPTKNPKIKLPIEP